MPQTFNLATSSICSRQYETEADLIQMQELLMEARARTDDWHYAHIGELVFRFLTVACHLNPYEHFRLWFDSRQLVGYAVLGEDPSFDFQVLSDYEWRGIETEAMIWAETLAAQFRIDTPERWSGNFVAGARQDNARRIDFLEKNGFRLGGQFSEVNMLRSLDGPIPEVKIPSGYQVRAMNPDREISNRAGAHREVWLPWTDGNISDADYEYFMRLPGYQADLDIVAVSPDEVIAAFVNGWIDSINKIGDLGEVGARPAYRRQGLTRAVLVECMRRMQKRGMNRVCVSTGVSNTAAIRLYESIGFKIVNRYLEYVKPN